jgi:hypothetical protein
MFGRTLRLPLVRDAVTAYRQQGMLNGSTPESSWQSHVKGGFHLTLGCDPQVRTFMTPMPLFLLGLVLSLPLCFMRTFVIFYAILHTLVRPFVLYSPTRHICSLPLLSVLTLLISLCSGLDKGILGY